MNFVTCSLEKQAYIYILKNVVIHTIHCIFQLNWTVETVKHQQLLLLFTQIIIMENCQLIIYELKTLYGL